MIRISGLDEAQERSLLGRMSPLVKLAVAGAWLVGLTLTLDPRPPFLLALLAVMAGVILGRVPVGRYLRTILPLVLSVLAVAALNVVFAASNADPSATEVAHVGPLRVTPAALSAGAAIALRLLAVASVGIGFVLTTDPTRLVDSLVQQAHLPERFAYGALAAVGAVPRVTSDLNALRGARRLRGLRGWHPRLLLGLLVLALRHADRLALAMDARAFGSGPRSRFREVRWTAADAVVGMGGLALLVVALLLGSS